MITIPSKADKQRSTLVDSLRIMSWAQYKSHHKLTGQDAFNGYSEFSNEWEKHEIHSYDLKKVQKFVKDLGYTEEELLQSRSEYYQRKYEQNQKAPQNPKFVEAPSPFGGNTPLVDEFDEPPY
jgi:hypothetical protein